MLLTRIPRSSKCVRCTAKRSISTVGYEDMPKLTAFRFAKTPLAAEQHMSIIGGMLTGSSPLKVAQSLLASFTSSSFFDYIKPTKFSAAYFPAWIVNGEAFVDISYKDAQWNASSVFLKQTYIPGSHMPVLSAASLWTPSLEHAESVPYSQSLLNQHGEEVQCIPFSVSPFSLLDVAKSSDLRFNSNLSFSSSSIKENFFSASPVLIPVYIARYDPDGTSWTGKATLPVTVITPGVEMDWTCIVEGATLQVFQERIGHITKNFLVPNDSTEIHEAETCIENAPSRINGSIPALRFRGYDTDKVFEELNDQLNYSSNIATLANARNLEDDLNDARIREYTEEEIESVDTYFNFRMKLLELGFVKKTIGSLQLPEGVKIKTPLDDIINAELAEKDAVPKWWTEYKASLESKSKEE